jgi:hypothetical protein
MPSVTITLSSPKPFKHRRALIDEGEPAELELAFEDDAAVVQLARGPHQLTWFVEGSNGQRYTLAVTASDPGDCLGDSTMVDGQDQGTCDFEA